MTLPVKAVVLRRVWGKLVDVGTLLEGRDFVSAGVSALHIVVVYRLESPCGQ
jgi:hypothetical protein